jgi:hypothetical protein
MVSRCQWILKIWEAGFPLSRKYESLPHSHLICKQSCSTYTLSYRVTQELELDSVRLLY